MHKFCWREIQFAGTRYVSFSYELRVGKRLNCFNLQGSERPEVTEAFSFDRCELYELLVHFSTCTDFQLLSEERQLGVNSQKGVQDRASSNVHLSYIH